MIFETQPVPKTLLLPLPFNGDRDGPKREPQCRSHLCHPLAAWGKDGSYIPVRRTGSWITPTVCDPQFHHVLAS